MFQRLTGTGSEAMIDVASGHSNSALSPRQRPTFYLVDWLPPEFGAVGQYAVLFSREMAQSGRTVRLIGLSAHRRSDDRELFGESGELEIRRLQVKPFDKSRQLSRLGWAIASNFRLIWEVLKAKDARGADVLFTGSPPFMLYFAFLAKLLRGTRLVYRITDFYPEVLFAAWKKRPALFVILEKITWYLRVRVDEYQVLGEDQRRLLLAGGVPAERIVLKRDVSPVRISRSVMPAPLPSELRGRLALLYSGNYGVAHEVETIVKGLALHHHRGDGKFGLWLNASGSAIPQLVSDLNAEGIPFAITEPVPLEDLPALLAAADAHLVSLRSSFSGYVLPSKIYACLDSGRPIVFVGPKSSDVHLLCEGKRGLRYEYVEVGDIGGFAEALERLSEVAKEKRHARDILVR